MRIRPARTADLEAVRDLVERAYTPYVERIGVRPGPLDDDYAERIGNDRVWVVGDDGIVGLIVLVEQADHLLIENVAVDPNRQGEGFGRALLRFARRGLQPAASASCGSTPM